MADIGMKFSKGWGYRTAVVLLLALGATGCAVNPVTGEKELTLVSESQEMAIGKKNYGPYRQAQGGDYVADPEVARYVSEVGKRVRVGCVWMPMHYAESITNRLTNDAGDAVTHTAEYKVCAVQVASVEQAAAK